MKLIWVDYVVLGIILLSMIISLVRGFLKEALSLLSWAVAFWVALTFSYHLAGYLAGYLDAPSLRLGTAFVVLFVASLMIGALVGKLLAEMVDGSVLDGMDQVVGALFGAARGVLIVAALVMLAGLTPMPQDPWWQESATLRYVQPAAEWLRARLPESVAPYFVFE
jgi:membrane protein required for colicin V production